MAHNNNRPPQRAFGGPQEETGFADPLGNCNDFNLLNFINAEDAQTPADSPAVDARFFQQPQPAYFNPTAVHIPSMDEGLSPPLVGRASVEQAAMKVSPNSDYLGSYAPQTASSSHGQISPPDLLAEQQQRAFLGGQQEQFPIDLYLAGNEDLSDLNIGDFSQPTATAVPVVLGQKRRRTAVPMEEIKCDPSVFINSAANIDPQSAGSNGNMPLMSASSTNSSMNNEQSFDDWDECGNPGGGAGQRNIRFSPFQPQSWAPLLDGQHAQLSQLPVSVVADKGFSYSAPENCFINQKKNHFQITVLVKPSGENPPVFVFTPDTGLKEIRCFKVAFYGVKAEMLTSEIPIRQSASDRRPQPHMPEVVEVDSMVPKQKTIARLHFAETTMNNNRKNNKPNPDQRYFHLVVKLFAETTDGLLILVQAHASDKVIVRASNPGQFENQENELMWQKAGYNNIIHYGGPVAIGTDRPVGDAQLTVHGNIVSTGQHTRPSDRRVKEDILDVDLKEAMDRIAQVRVVEYSYKPDIAKEWGLKEEERHRVGVIAQELAQVIPDAVRDNGEFLTVDDARIFYDTVAAAQELYRLTGNLECKIDQVEKISAKLARYAQKKKQLGGSMASGLSDLSTLFGNLTEMNTAANRTVERPKDRVASAAEPKNGLSHSRLSLNSCAPSIDPSQVGSASQYGRSYGRKGRRYGESQLCNSRLTQATMVSLIVLMSICLVTMCTLYVLDWYNRTYVYTPHHFLPPPHFDSADSIGNIYTMTNWTPPAQPLVHPLLWSCPGLAGGFCQRFCCPPRNPNQTHDKGGGQAASSTRKPPLEVRPMNPPTPGPGGRPAGDGGGHSAARTERDDRRAAIAWTGAATRGRGATTSTSPSRPFMPTIPLHLRMTVEPDMYVDEHTFELTASVFMQSAYRFRVGHSADSCSLGADQRGRSFDELNFVFYRQCEV
ncbi:Myelin regulatory factor [Aphelenchoides fujianensis]|nr:Myelin regulatory factor [Aphelenchoides fujianensis]